VLKNQLTHDLNVGVISRSSQDEPADPPKSVDSHTKCHCLLLFLSMRLDTMMIKSRVELRSSSTRL